MSDDDLLRDFLSYSASSIEIDNSPTIFSLDDSIQLIIKKFGQDWIKNSFALQVVVWTSSTFIRDHVKEVSSKYNGLLELCEEFYINETIQGQPLDGDFYADLFDFINSFNKPLDHERFGTSPVSGCYWNF